MTQENKPARRPGRGHGKDRGRLYYVLWGVGIIGLVAFPTLLELAPKLAHRAVYIVPAILGNTEAQHEMAHSYRAEKFYSGNAQQKFLWHLRAAKQGDVAARNWIADFFSDVDRNPVIIHSRIMEKKGRPTLVEELRDAMAIKKEVDRIRLEPKKYFNSGAEPPNPVGP